VDLPDGTHSRILAMNTWCCYGEENTRMLYEDAKSKGVDIHCHSLPPVWREDGHFNTHAPHPFAYQIITDFITNSQKYEKDMENLSLDSLCNHTIFTWKWPECAQNYNQTLMICVDNRKDTYKHEILFSMWDAQNRGYIPTYVNASHFESSEQLDEWISSHKGLADILFYPNKWNLRIKEINKSIPYENPIFLPQVVRDSLIITTEQ